MKTHEIARTNVRHTLVCRCHASTPHENTIIPFAQPVDKLKCVGHIGAIHLLCIVVCVALHHPT